MSARSSPGVGRKSPAKAKAVSSSENGSVSSAPLEGGAAVGNGSLLHGQVLVGRKILKRLGDKTVMSGHVKEYNSPIDGKGESWTLRYENPHMEEGEEDNSDDDEEVNRAELDKLLNLQAVREREFPQTPSKKGRGRPKKGAAKPSKKRSAPASTSSESEPECEPESESSSQLTPVQPRKMPNKAKNTNKKKKKRRTSGGGGGDDDSVKLRGNDTDLGKRIAKEFSEGVFTGEVVEVKPTGARGILWKIDYEDGDMEDLNEAEMNGFLKQYKLLLDKFAEAKGHAITAADLAEEGLEDDDEDMDPSQFQSKGQGKPKSKGKGKNKKTKGTVAHEKLVGDGVRKMFDTYDEWYDGKVTKYKPPEIDDEYGDLWRIKYEDGDVEDMGPEELADCKKSYKKRYALVRKRVANSTNTLFAGQPATNLSQKGSKMTLYGESPVGKRGIFSTIKGYRRYKEMHPST